MIVTMRSIMRLSGPPRPPKLPLPGAGPDGLPCPYPGAMDAPLLQRQLRPSVLLSIYRAGTARTARAHLWRSNFMTQSSHA